MRKKKIFSVLAAICAGFTFVSCSNEIEDVTSFNGLFTDPTRGTELSITKVGTSGMTDVTKATATEVDAWATAPDKNIGVSVYSSAAGTEAMKTGSVNMKWTYNTSSEGWETLTPLQFFPGVGDEGVVTAYYPYSESADPTAIDIDGTKDYMYALIGDNKTVNYGSPQTSLLMHHANAQIRVNLIRKGYAGTGTISSFSVKGSKFASAGKLNSLTGVVSNYTMAPELTGINEGTLAADISATPTAKVEALYTWFVPVSDAAAPVTFDATIDGLKLRYTTDQKFEAGKRYTFNLAITLNRDLMLTSVDIDPWTDENKDGDLELVPPAENNPIDLGLPSGLKWAAGNLGADEPQQSGLFFAWGETTGYENGSGHVFDNSHYTASAIYTNLTLAQDAANVRLGGNWRMPTKKDNLELCANCFAEWTTNYDGTGKAGVIFYSTTSNATGKGYYKGASAWKMVSGTSYTNASQPGGFVAYTLATPHIFIPAAGYFSGSALLSNEGTFGYCWSSSWNSASGEYHLSFGNGGVNPQGDNNRYCGMPVRAVLAE